MMGSRKGFRERRRQRKAAQEETARKADVVRAEARQASKRRTSERRRARVARWRNWRGELRELWTWVKASSLEIGRRLRRGFAPLGRLRPLAARVWSALRPVLSPIGLGLAALWRGTAAVLGPVAPFVAAGLFGLVRGLGALLSGILVGASWVRGVVVTAATATHRWVRAHVTAARASAAVAIAACVAIAVSQFLDYRGIAIGADQYRGEAGDVAPVPQLNQEIAGDAHAYVMLPLALAAAALGWLALRGRPRLALGVAALGLAGVGVTLAVDLPQALDTGRIGEAYEGADARLLTGFWMQLIGSALLLISGVALWLFLSGTRRGAPSARSSRRGADAPASGQGAGPAGSPGAAGSGAGA